MARRHDSTATKEKILDAAAIVFGRKGFRAATIADICGRAGTNIASVNYHFGDKETLFVEAWKHAFRRSHEIHPAHGGVPETAPPEERLRGWITSFIKRVTDPQSWDIEMLHKEMANPTGLLFEAMRELIEPLQKKLRGILRDCLGEGASEEDVQLCEMSVQSQCMNPRVLNKRHGGRQDDRPRPGPPPLTADPDRIADHVIRFCLEGLPGARRGIEARKREKPGTSSPAP